MRKLSGITYFATFMAVCALLLSACGNSTTAGSGTPTTSKTVSVALVTDIGGLNDGGFNQLAYAGYTQAQQKYGFKRVVIQTNSQNDYVQNLTTAANQADMVIAVGFLMQTPLDRIAKQYPNKKFAIVDGCAVPDPNTGACENLPNVAPLFFKEQEAGCLVGAMAGQMELDGKAKAPKLLGHNTIGAVGGLPIPPVDHYIAGYKYCAQKVDPSIKVVVGYSNDFTDPAKCQAVANSQITDDMADIIFQVAGGCGLGAIDAATAKGVYSIGVDSDQAKDSSGKARPSVITSAEKRVDVAVDTIINDVQTGKYDSFVTQANSSNPPLFDLANNGVGYAPPSSEVPADAVQTAQNYESMIKAGTLTPPAKVS
jgi:basic membrane protein A and related proteins